LVSWKVWALAIEALSWIELRGINEQSAMRRTVNQLEIRDEDAMERGYHMLFQTSKRLNTIDYLIDEAIEEGEAEDYEIGVKSFLRLYTYATKYLEVSFEEAMNIADIGRKLLGKDKIETVEPLLHLIPYMNLTLPEGDEIKKLAFTTFHPSWFVEYCIRVFGVKKTLKILRVGDPPTYVRLNKLKSNSESIIGTLRKKGVILVKDNLTGVYRVKKTEEHLPTLRPYREGLLIIQDKASAYAIEAAAPKPGWTVLDVCAAPGIKTSHMAQLMNNCGLIYSIDYSERRMNSWRGLTSKMGVKNAKPILGDAKKEKTFPDIKADLVLVDPPCTGTGIFWRTPSAKWRINKTSINNMADIQWKILRNSAPHVKKGGYLLYSTCSITIEENEEIITKLLEAYPGFAPVKLAPDLGTPGLNGLKNARRLYPYADNCNGFFISKLRNQGI